MAARELRACADHPGSEFLMSNHKRPGIRSDVVKNATLSAAEFIMMDSFESEQ